MFMVNRFVMMSGKVSVDLWSSAVDDDQTNTQAVQQADVIDDTGKVFMFNGFATQHDDKRFSPMGIDVGNGMAKSLDQLGSTFLYHGTTLSECLFVFCVFLFDYRRVCKPKFLVNQRIY
ncbi:hypothetical protein D3C78_791670 [compost metagenome]